MSPEQALEAVLGEVVDEYGIQYARVHGYRRAYVRAGHGPPVLLLHGIGDSSGTWAGLIPLLAEHFTVVAPDLLGHGRSDRPRADYSVPAYACGMRDLLALLDIERATLVGHSLGGGIAMQMSYQFPELVERLVLVAPGGVGPEVHPLLRLATLPGAPTFLPVFNNKVTRSAGRTMVRALAMVSPAVATDADEIFETMAAMADGASRSAFCRTLRSAADMRGQAVTILDRCYLAEWIPTLLMWGAMDPVLPVAHAYIAASAMPSARLEIFERAGHFPHHADPMRFLDTLRQFIETTEPARYDVAEWRGRLHTGSPQDTEIL
jgi:pimeloyl-ACP methyl ester carboxylesterase